MTIRKLKEKLKGILERSKLPGFDQEAEHGKADSLLLECIGNLEVEKLFHAIPKWYA